MSTSTPSPASTAELLTTAQVARYLGVKTETVYAYVSRGRLTPVRHPGQRASLFHLAQVQALRPGSTRTDASGGSVGRGLAESIHTSITLLEKDHLYYRGQDAVVLAESGASAEDVCRLLWEAPEVAIAADEELAAATRAGLAALPPGARLVDRLRLAVLLLGAADPLRHVPGAQDVIARAAVAVPTVAAALSPAGQPPRHPKGENAGTPTTLAARWCAAVGGSPDDPESVDLVRRVLVLLADHDMAGSTTAVRVSASVRADLYSCLLAGLSAMDSPLHGSAGLDARVLAASVREDPTALLGRVLASERPPAGFGHKVYVERDPRAESLLTTLRNLPDTQPDPWRDFEDALMAHRGWFPTSDWALALLTLRQGWAGEATEVLFAAARLAGWVAHVLEEQQEPALRFRLTGVYRGPRP